jgi:hypothetical protein
MATNSDGIRNFPRNHPSSPQLGVRRTKGNRWAQANAAGRAHAVGKQYENSGGAHR